ncbi:TPA: DUF551 domain-containing protein [Kluyvera georgiana]
MTNNQLPDSAPVTDADLDHMILGLERDGIYPKLLSLMRELRERRKAKSEPVSQPYTLPENSFTNEDLEGMTHGNNPQSNAYRELLAFRRNSPVTPDCWIPVSERMPGLSEDVLVSTEFFGPGDWRIKVGHIQSDSKEWHVYGATWEPTYWHPLPAAPKEVR